MVECNDCCIHDSLCGCRMLDCFRHPDSEDYALKMSTNTFSDRFVDKNAGAWIDTNKKEVSPCPK